MFQFPQTPVPAGEAHVPLSPAPLCKMHQASCSQGDWRNQAQNQEESLLFQVSFNTACWWLALLLEEFVVPLGWNMEWEPYSFWFSLLVLVGFSWLNIVLYSREDKKRCILMKPAYINNTYVCMCDVHGISSCIHVHDISSVTLKRLIPSLLEEIEG